jgi:hypothetical protein
MAWLSVFVNEDSASVTHPAKNFSKALAQGGSSKIKLLHLIKRFSNSSFSSRISTSSK